MGEIISYSGGIYTIKSDTLGTISLEKDKIRDIREEPSKASKDLATSPGNTSIQNRAKALQESMTGNPDIIKSIDSLQNDPDFQQVMNDPELMKAINSGDISKLLASPKFMKLLNKPAVQEIGKKLTP